MSIAAVLFVFSFTADKYKGIIGFVAIVFLTAALYIFTRYMAIEYYYDITLSGGEPLFVVRQATCKRSTTMTRISLSSITDVKVENAKERKGHKAPSGYARYCYVPTFMPDKTVRITVASRYEKAEIVIEGSAEFAELILAYSREAKVMYPDDEE